MKSSLTIMLIAVFLFGGILMFASTSAKAQCGCGCAATCSDMCSYECTGCSIIQAVLWGTQCCGEAVRQAKADGWMEDCVPPVEENSQ